MSRRRFRLDFEWVIVGAVALVILAAILVPTVYTIASYQNDRTLTCTVEDKDRAGKDGEMRVYTEDCGNLKVSDALFAGNFHSSDTYREIEVGETYDFEVIGYRIPFFSEFPNILSASPAN